MRSPLSLSFAKALLPFSALVCVSPLAAQERNEAEASKADQEIIVSGEAAEDSGESTSERVRRVGRAITRPARSGQPIARFDAPLCLKVSGMPEDIAAIVKTRIEENARPVRGIKIDDDADCSPNAFLGFVNNVNETVKQLEEDEPWLFDGLLSFQVDRIYRGSDTVRAWHRFDTRNLDGSTLPGDRNVSSNRAAQIGELTNNVEVATRLIKIKTNIIGAVVLIETGATADKTLRQIADYATIRLLASVSDDVKSDPNTPETMLTLFNDGFGPEAITPFDMAYLEALYELPANSRDGTVITAAVSRYEDRVKAEAQDNPAG